MKQIILEQWRPVNGYEEFYAVSSLGRVKSIERTCKHWRGGLRRVKEQLLKPAKNSRGYLFVRLYKNGVGKPYFVHRLVAEAFIPNPCPEKYDVVNHKIEGDEGKIINTVDNLEWCDYDYNSNYGTCQERKAKAMKGKFINRSDQSKTVYQYTKNYELVGEYSSTMEVHRQMGFAQSNICACCNGKRKTAYNYVWSYEPLSV